MDPLLERRYLELLWAYSAGGTGYVQVVKHRLMQAMPEYQLRADAALCLLTLYDQMILKPYYGSLPGRDEFPRSPDLDVHRPAPNLDVVQQSLSLILERIRLGSFERPISSHSALVIVQDVWPQLSEMFFWG